MKASVKRLIWALGYPLMTDFSHLVSYYGGNVYDPNLTSASWIYIVIWIIPLICFTDDKK